jgi:hypothetical protein
VANKMYLGRIQRLSVQYQYGARKLSSLLRIADRDHDMEENCEGKPEPISRRHHYQPRLVHGRSKTGGSRGTTAGGSRGTTLLVAHVVLLSGRVLNAVFKLPLGEFVGSF